MKDESIHAFAEVLGDGEQTALLLDHRGAVRAGIYVDSRGADVSAEIGAALSGVGSEATRAMRHLALGEWRAIVCECTEANLAFAPADDGDIVLVAAAPACRMASSASLDMVSQRALAWRREVADQELELVVAGFSASGRLGAMLVGMDDGMVIAGDAGPGRDADTAAALAASLFRRTRTAAADAGLGDAGFVRLEADRGHLCATARGDVVLVAPRRMESTLESCGSKC